MGIGIKIFKKKKSKADQEKLDKIMVHISDIIKPVKRAFVEIPIESKPGSEGMIMHKFSQKSKRNMETLYID